MALKSKIEQVSEEMFFLRETKAMVEFAPGVMPADVANSPKTVSVRTSLVTAGYEVAKWGANNQKPAEMLRLVGKNHIKPQLLQTEQDFLMGSRLGHFKYVIKDGKRAVEHVDVDAEIEDWEYQVGLEEYWTAVCSNWVYFRNIPNYATLDSRTKKVNSIDVIDCVEIRKEVMKAGKIDRYFRHPNWMNPVQGDIQVLNSFDRLNPTSVPDFVYWTKSRIPGQPYYSYAPWWGTENWTEISNDIPAFHVAGLKNGYNIKYHIKVPYEYLLKLTGGSEDPKLILEKKREIAGDMDTFLAGIKNKDKAFITFAFKDMTSGKEALGWEINPLDNKMTDEAYIKLDEHANVNQASGHGVSPSLAGIDTGRGLGISGSELRITYDTHIALRTPQPRALCTQFLNQVVMRLNGWKDKGFFYGIEDVQMTTLEVNPTGKQGVVNQQM